MAQSLKNGNFDILTTLNPHKSALLPQNTCSFLKSFHPDYFEISIYLVAFGNME